MDGAFPSQRGDFDAMSGGGRGGRGGRTGFRGTAENAKTKLCTRWMQGDCRFGDRCNFAHGDHELRNHPEGGDPRGRGGPGGGYGGGGRGGPGRGYGGGGGGYGGGYGQVAYGMEQMPQQGGYDQRPGGMQEDVWAAQGYPVPGPAGWCMYRTKDTGETYFHNHRTGITTWERPPEWPLGGVI